MIRCPGYLSGTVVNRQDPRSGRAWHDLLAAVDLGSNSFHLQIGRVVGDQIYLLDSLREPVRLGAGLTRDGRIDRSTQIRALPDRGSCLFTTVPYK